MLDYITRFENTQTLFVICVAVIIGIFAVGFNVRRAMLVKDVEAENEMRRKIQWHNIQNQQLIESSRTIVEEGGNE